jgi:hypothetical protein
MAEWDIVSLCPQSDLNEGSLPMVRKLLAVFLLATLAACASDITAADADQTQGGTMVTSGG